MTCAVAPVASCLQHGGKDSGSGLLDCSNSSELRVPSALVVSIGIAPCGPTPRTEPRATDTQVRGLAKLTASYSGPCSPPTALAVVFRPSSGTSPLRASSTKPVPLKCAASSMELSRHGKRATWVWHTTLGTSGPLVDRLCKLRSVLCARLRQEAQSRERVGDGLGEAASMLRRSSLVLAFARPADLVGQSAAVKRTLASCAHHARPGSL